jgi:hypothetical protein
MNIRKLLTLATAGTAAATISLFGMAAAYAVDQPVTFEVTGGSLAIAQTPTAGTALTQGTAVNMPVTTVTDGRNEFGRTAFWTVSANVTALSAGVVDVGAGIHTIGANQITLDETSGSFTSGSGTRVPEAAVVGGALPSALVSATGDSIDSVFTYTPTALLGAQTLPYSGSYTGTVSQTVV